MNEKELPVFEDLVKLLESGEMDGTDLPVSTDAIMEYFAEEAEKLGMKPALYGSIFIDCCDPITLKVFESGKRVLKSNKEFVFYPTPGPTSTLVCEFLGTETVANDRIELIQRIQEEIVNIYQTDPMRLLEENEEAKDVFEMGEKDGQ
jgi:hypothetical protein